MMAGINTDPRFKTNMTGKDTLLNCKLKIHVDNINAFQL
jgi:hypothetical protein